jgi:hypothetical protein|tara:strand:+ start:479 stop:808 length:330 start_codon:yes stop_codon:yes gene_type:complete
MPYKNKPRPYKKEWKQEQSRNEKKSRAARARARRLLDKKLPDKNKNGKADKREGKDIAHRKALSKGGKNKDGLIIQTKSKNRSFKRNSQHKLVSEKSKRESKKKKNKKK